MSFARLQTLNGAVLLSTGNVAAAVFTLLRNILIARLISVEDFGIAATFAIATTLIETGTNLGIDRMIVRDPRGGQRSFMAALHGVMLLRGGIGALLTLVFAPYLARVFGHPELAWAYQCLALIPLIRGFLHFGMFRAQRSMRYRPFVSATITASALAVASAIPLGLWLQDYRAMLGAVLVQQLVFVVGSHIAGSCRFQIRWDLPILKDCLGFGLPMLANGFVIFAALNGDQMLIGAFLGMETLGWFAVAFTLTLVPTTVLANTVQSLMLPRLSRSRSDPKHHAQAVRSALQITAGLAVVTCAMLALVGPIAVELLFGQKYAIAAAWIPWLAVLQGIRIAKTGPAIVAIASGHTQDPLIANLARLVMFPFALTWLSNGGDVLSVILLAILGEVAALILSVALLARRQPVAAPKRIGRVQHG